MVVDVVIWLVSLDLVGAVGVAGSLHGTAAVVVFLSLLSLLLLVLVLLLLLLGLVLSSSSSMILGRLNFLAIFFQFRCCLLFRLARISVLLSECVFRCVLLDL